MGSVTADELIRELFPVKYDLAVETLVAFFQRHYIRHHLVAAEFNASAAARAAQMDRRTLYRIIRADPELTRLVATYRYRNAIPRTP